MTSRSALRCLAVGLALSAPSLQAEDDAAAFAFAFPLSPPAGESVFAIELTPEVYATLTTPDLRDLAVVDAEGRRQSISVQRAGRAAPSAPTATPVARPIRMPREATRSAETLDLHVSRDRDGRLVAIDLASRTSDATQGPEEWIVDMEAVIDEGYDGLRIAPIAASPDFRVRVSVFGSNDLAAWSTVAHGLPLLRATGETGVIERLDLGFDPVRYRYLTLRPEGEGALPSIESLHALRKNLGTRPTERTHVLTPAGPGGESQRFDFLSPGPLPVTTIAVEVAEPNGLHEFTLSQSVDNGWTPLLRGTAWQVAVDGEALRSGPFATALPGIGPLRIETRRPAAPLRLSLTYRPDQVIVLASGNGPYRLLAGSGRFRGDPAAMSAALDAIRASRGPAWAPPLASLGPAQALNGETALQTGPLVEPGRIALWGVLGLGALLVGGAAWRLLRESPPSKGA